MVRQSSIFLQEVDGEREAVNDKECTFLTEATV